MATVTKTKPANTWTSRAVTRPVDPGSSALCALCGDGVRFRAKLHLQQVICNVYDHGTWKRVEHFHVECYETAGQPYGESTAELRRNASR